MAKTTLSPTARQMLWRGIRMGAQGFYTGWRNEQAVCERERRRGRLAFKGGRRSRGCFQFFVVTPTGRAAYSAAG